MSDRLNRVAQAIQEEVAQIVSVRSRTPGSAL